MILIYEKNTTFACIYTKSFALFRESFEFIRESFAFIRESFAFIRESYAFVRESFALIREFFFLYENEPNKGFSTRDSLLSCASNFLPITVFCKN